MHTSAMQTPAQDIRYLGSITDTDRWANFQHRPDDIFICTPPKCGTTWTQAICSMLVFGEADYGQQTSDTSLWIDAVLAPIDDLLVQIDKLPHRRFIKTHTALDGIPYHPECTYLVVMRDPRDAYCSGLNKRDNMNDEDLTHAVFPTGDDAYETWLSREYQHHNWDIQSISTFVHFFNSYWPYRNLPNVHLYHYSDMKHDLRTAIKSIAAATETEVTDDQLDAFTEAATFCNTKKKTEQFASEPGSGLCKSENSFFSKGVSQQWEKMLSEDQIKAFDVKFAALLQGEEADWLLNGVGS